MRGGRRKEETQGRGWGGKEREQGLGRRMESGCGRGDGHVGGNKVNKSAGEENSVCVCVWGEGGSRGQ